MLTTEQRISVVCWRLEGKSFAAVQERFRQRYRSDAPTRENIRLLVNKFRRTGSVNDEQRSGRPPIAEEHVERLREAIERSPKASTRRLSREHPGISHSSVWRTLRYTLKKKPYRFQVLHHLEPADYAARQEMCADLVESAESENLMDNALFSDEATFHICGMVNRHNTRIWANQQPHETLEWERATPKVNVWLGLMKGRIYGPFFFAEGTVTSEIYLDMLQIFLEPQMLSDGILDTVIFQQDGAPPHFAHIVRDYLDETFPDRWIGRGSRRIWAPRSPDLTPLDFFAWGYIKSHVYKVTITSIEQLKARIVAAVDTITPRMQDSVFRDCVERWRSCVDMQGGHVELY